jgi:hypothetical protein
MGTEKFCSQCGTPFDSVSSNNHIVINEEKNSSFKKYPPYILGAIALIAVCGGWCLFNIISSSVLDVKSNTKDSTEGNDISLQTVTDSPMKELCEYFSFNDILALLNSPNNSSYAKNCGLSKIYEDTNEKGYYGVLYGYDVVKGDKNTVTLGYKVELNSNHAYYFCYTSAGEESMHFCFKNKEDADYIFKFAEDYGLIEYNGTYFVPSSKISSGIKHVNESSIGEYGIIYSMSAPEEMDGEYFIWIYNLSKQRKIDVRIENGGSSYPSADNSQISSLSSNSNTSSSSRTFYSEQIVIGYLANQSFRASDGLTMRVDGDGRLYVDGQYAGVLSVLRYNSTSALLRYGGGMYGEGKLTVQIVGDKFQLKDPTDGTVYYQR